MGSFVKSVKKKVKKVVKKVKKVVKKSPIAKVVKKVAKGIKKLGGKVWDGIKKVGGKALRAFSKFSQKIGPVGMIALSFAMPYLSAGFSAGWNAMGGWLGAGAQSSNVFLNTMSQIGHTAWKAIDYSAAFVKGTYQGITQTLGKTFKSFGQGNVKEGFSNLWGGTKDVVSGRAGMGTEKFITQSVKDAALGIDTEILQGTGDFTRAGGITGAKASGVVQTGGVGAAKANVLNQQSYAHIQNAMANTQALYSPDMQKYVNTLQNQYNIDAYTAHNHAMSHGGIENMGGPGGQYGSIDLDFTKSSDFTFNRTGGPPNVGTYNYTGGASEAAFKDKGLNYVGIRDNAFKVKGDTYHYGESGQGISLLDKGKSAAGAYLSNLAGDDGGPAYIPYAGGADTSLNPFGTRYDGTNVSHAGGGQFLTEEQKKYFAGQDLNIQGA